MSVAKKRKRKFRAMTNQEYCNKRNNCTNCVFNKYYSWCDNALINTRNDSWHKEKFCPNCGQALDWSVKE